MKRREAIQSGIETYNTGRACKHGHLADRKTLTGACLACTKINNKVNNARYAKKVKEDFKANLAKRLATEANAEANGNVF